MEVGMLFEFFAFGFVAVGGVGMVACRGWSDKRKLAHIFETNNLLIKLKRNGNESVQRMKLKRKTRHTWGTEYAYKIPLGMSFEQIEAKYNAIQDGLNNKRKGVQKEIEMDYDGMLRIKVFDQPLPEEVPYDMSILNSGHDWKVPFGVTREKTIYHDFDKIPHIIVAGTTRYGKTVFLKGLITHLAFKQPKHTDMTLIDLKGGLAFNRFKTLCTTDSMASNPSEALSVLTKIENLINERQKEFSEQGFEDIKEADIPKRHFIIIDEAAELSSAGHTGTEKKVRQECERIMAHIARIGGGLGFRLVFCTQYPTADTLPRQIKQNCDARLCFRLQTQKASEVVLEQSGAEDLPYIKGRAIYKTDRLTTLQVPYIKNDFIETMLTPLRREEEQHEQLAEIETERRTDTLVIG
jgi:DNA segregation ATPase FtsK/SpoIIIE, S-DNA-T family